MKQTFALITALMIAIILLSITATAQEHATESHDTHAARYHTGIFIGAASSMQEKTSNFALGIDLERRIRRHFGIGLMAESVFAEHIESLIAVPLFFHAGSLKCWLAPGIEFAKEIDEAKTAETGKETLEMKEVFLIRAGLGYDIHLGKFSISPAVNLDFAGEKTSLVYGVGLGMAF